MQPMIPLLTAMLPVAAAAQSQPAVSQGVPPVAIPPTTEVIVIQTPKQGVTVQQIVAVMPSEIRATVKLYLDGKIREWFSRGDGKGVVFVVEPNRGRSANPDGNVAACEGTPDGSPVHSRWTADAAEDVDQPRCAPVTSHRNRE